MFLRVGVFLRDHGTNALNFEVNSAIKLHYSQQVDMTGDSPPVGSQQPQAGTKDSEVTLSKRLNCILFNAHLLMMS